MDLHALTRIFGTPTVAEKIGVSVRSLEDMRRGHSPITIDELFELGKAFADFDAVGTIRRIGFERVRKGRARKLRNQRA